MIDDDLLMSGIGCDLLEKKIYLSSSMGSRRKTDYFTFTNLWHTRRF